MPYVKVTATASGRGGRARLYFTDREIFPGAIFEERNGKSGHAWKVPAAPKSCPSSYGSLDSVLILPATKIDNGIANSSRHGWCEACIRGAGLIA